MNKNEHKVIVINPFNDFEDLSFDEWRDEDKREGFFGTAIQFSSDTLRKNTQLFLDDVSIILEDLTTTITGYELDSVEISAAMTVTGKLGILNLGGEIGGEGALKFIFKRKT
jgi:hypothetical protein